MVENRAVGREVHLERRKMIDLNIKKATLLCKGSKSSCYWFQTPFRMQTKDGWQTPYKADGLSPKIPPLRVFGIG